MEGLGGLARRAGGADTWTNGGYDNMGQVLFVETVVFVVILSIAVLFELGHHQLHHFLEHKARPDSLRDN